MASIILTGGGTAGHCTPHIAILPYLKKNFDKIYYIGSENGIEKDIINKENIPYFSIPCAKLNRKIDLQNLTIPFKLISGVKHAQKLIDQLNPDVIFSKGGYVSVPTVIAGRLKKIPVISHESDLTVGLANKITAKYCKKVLTSFPETALEIRNGEYVGSPIRTDLFSFEKEKSLKYFGFSGNKPILLITGGSQGAKQINKVVLECLPDLLEKFDIIHICGKGNLNKFKDKGYFQTEYLYDIGKAYAITDICITRAGANSLFELLYLKIPCVLIPLPKGISRGDQVLNARYFQKKGYVCVLEQNVLTKKSLILAVNATYTSRINIKKALNSQPILDASKKISKIICDEIKH